MIFRIIDMRVVKLDEMQKSYNEPSHLRPVRSNGRVINVLSKKRSEKTWIDINMYLFINC